MKKIIFLLFALALNTNANLTATATFESRLTLQEQTFNAKIELQDQAIQNLKSQFKESNKYQDLRRDVLDSQENTIGWWLSVFAISLALFGIFGFFVAKDKIQEFERLNKYAKQLNKNAETELKKIKQHAKMAKQSVTNITKMEGELNNIKKISSSRVIADESSTKLKKMIAEARKLEADNKIEQAITLWQEIVTIAKYENNKEQQAGGYFYLGYLYVQYTTDYDKSIEFSQQAIEIKHDFHEAYSNMGIAYRKLGGDDNLQKAIAAYQKSIEIEPDGHEVCYNMGIAYEKLWQYKEAISAYEQAIKISPETVKHSKKANWDELNTWIEILDDSATKKKYQAILKKLKGE